MPAAGDFYRTLIDSATAYLALGWSVIPLYGDQRPDAPKVAALEWAPFQRRRAAVADVTRWFERQGCAALGIVTGSVSQLVILDFDAPALLRDFERACPDLTATRVVETRRGQHLYFHLPPQLVTRSQKLDGLDLLAGGRYAVAPPSIIDGFAYGLRRGGRPKSLAQADLSRIDAFLESVRLQASGAPYGIAPACPVEAAPAQASELPASQPAEPFNAGDLVRLYRGLARQSKRNVALFKASCLARDHGWPFAATVECLADVHAAEPERGAHRPESDRSRYREAVATIRSVYTRPPRRPAPADTDRGGLHNSLRERLFRRGLTCVVRVIEGLRLVGFKPGQAMTEKDVLHALRGIVGRHSIRRALLATTEKGREIFTPNPPRHPPSRAAARPIRIVNTKNAIVSDSKPDRSDSAPHRPPRTFVIPGVEQLSRWFGVEPSGSDPICLDDLRTARRTRVAAHRELIRRRPGLYLRCWLADRLGVSHPTISRYNHLLEGLQVTPTFTQTAIGWWNLKSVPACLGDTTGAFLEDGGGRRWPALKAIASRLLGQGKTVKLLAQSLNDYRFGGVSALLLPAAATPTGSSPPIAPLSRPVARLIRSLPTHPTSPEPPPRPHKLEVTRSEPPLPVIDYGKRRKKRPRYDRPFRSPDAEALAQRVYRLVNQRAGDPTHKISLATARRAVDQAGEDAVRKALWTLERRKNVIRPAGWLLAFLRPAIRVAQQAR